MRRLSTRDGSRYEFNLKHYLELAREDVIAAEFDRSFAAGALLALGDALAAHGYFDRAPELELVRHLRNAVAHGNRFEIRNPTELQTHPANNADAWGRSGSVLEITPNSQGRVVLFDFLAPGDVVGVLRSVEDHLVFGPSEPPWQTGED